MADWTAEKPSVAAQPQAVLVWLGAGDGEGAGQLCAEYGQVVLAEVNEACQPQLAQLQARYPTLDVWSEAIAAHSGPGQYFSYNLPQFNALAPATGLCQLYPGLKLQEQTALQTVAVSELLETLAFDDDALHELRVHLPAQARSILQALADSGQLALFASIRVQTGRTELYQDAGNAAALIDWLADQGYQRIEADELDPDLPLLRFTRHKLSTQYIKLQRHCQRLEQQLSDSAATRQQLTEAQTQRAELTTLLATQTEAMAAERQQQEQALAQAQQETAALRQQLAAQSETAATERQQLAAQSAATAAQHQQAEQELAALRQALEVANARAAGAEQQQQETVRLQQLVNQSKQTLEQSLQSVNTLQEQLEQQQAKHAGETATLQLQLAAEKQQAAQKIAELSKQRDTLQQQLQATEQQTKQQLAESAKKADTLSEQQEKLQSTLNQVQKHAANRLDKIAELEKLNRQLAETNQQLNQRQQVLEQEMLKAEAQIDIIKELILRTE